jgi:hypothetical protein
LREQRERLRVTRNLVSYPPELREVLADENGLVALLARDGVPSFVAVLEVHDPLEGKELELDLFPRYPLEPLPAHEHLRVLVQVHG